MVERVIELRISVVIPVKDRAELAAEAVGSVLDQGFEAVEVVVVDDGSADNARERLGELAARDRRVRVLEREGARAGACAARNTGLRAARGDLVVFLDSDDVLGPGCLAGRVRFMEGRRELDFAVSDGEYFVERPGDDGRRLPGARGEGDLDVFLRGGWPWQTCGPTWRRSSLLGLGGWDDSLRNWQDVELHVRALARGLAYQGMGSVDYYIRHGSYGHATVSGAARGADYLRSARRVVGLMEAELGARGLLGRRRRLMVAGAYLYVSEGLGRSGRVASAVGVWRRVKRRRLAPWWLGALAGLSLRWGGGRVGAVAFGVVYSLWPAWAWPARPDMRRSPGGSPRRMELRPWRPSGRWNRAVVADGWLRGLARLLVPRRVRDAVRGNRGGRRDGMEALER